VLVRPGVAVCGPYLLELLDCILKHGVPVAVVTERVNATDVTTLKAPVAATMWPNQLLLRRVVSTQFVQQVTARVVDLNALDVTDVPVMLTDLT